VPTVPVGAAEVTTGDVATQTVKLTVPKSPGLLKSSVAVLFQPATASRVVKLFC